MNRRTDLNYWQQRLNAQEWVRWLAEAGTKEPLGYARTLWRMEEIHEAMVKQACATEVSPHVLARMLHDAGFHRAGNGFGVRTCHGQRRLWVLVPGKQIEALEAGALYDEERK